MTTIYAQVYKLIDSKMDAIAEQRKLPAVIVMSSRIFKQIQQEMMFRDASQSHGVVRNPFDLQVYRKVKIVPSEMIDLVEVF